MSHRTDSRVAAALVVRGRRFVWGERTYLMGIVNATPDSFSGDGRPTASAAIAHARTLLEAGADVVDIGAESTRPGYSPIDEGEELRRLLPVVRGLRAAAPAAVVSVDTFKADVFAAAREAGGDILNSIWAPSDELLALAAAAGVPVVIMHNKRVAIYEHDVVDEVFSYLAAQAERAVRAGVAPEAVIVDPGIGFGKRSEHNLSILGALGRLRELGFPTLVGTSRKSTVGRLTSRPVDARAFGTAATVALAVAAKIDIVRVHDVSEMYDVVRVADAIVRGWRPARLERRGRVSAVDTIELREVRAYGRHGANPRERDYIQPLDLSLRLEVDLSTARATDDLAATVDYADLHARVVRIVAQESYRLLERLGERILEEAMRDERVATAEVTIAKPRLLAGATPAVTLRRTRG